MNRLRTIREEVDRRKIRHLCHFTREESLAAILSDKEIKPRNQLPKDCPNVTDPARFDGRPQSISLSIEFPNYKMFYRKRCQDPSARWVVLQFSSNVLWVLDCAFCAGNAAMSEYAGKPLNELCSVNALRGCFQGITPHCSNPERSELAIPDNYPTDPQAEVLVLEPIPLEGVQLVLFPNSGALQLWCKTHPRPSRPKMGYDKKLFGPRIDYKHWKLC